MSHTLGESDWVRTVSGEFDLFRNMLLVCSSLHNCGSTYILENDQRSIDLVNSPVFWLGVDLHPGPGIK